VMTLTRGGKDGAITVSPFVGESCEVTASIKPASASADPLVGITAEGGGVAAVTFVLKVTVARDPNGASESVDVSGEWQANGKGGADCNGTGKIAFRVIVLAAAPPPAPTSANAPGG